ncbi:hypothetical protein J2Z44_000950 [Clostridium punense]|uniref:Uncharacterized protein n=1 Tax=Clostridium punense TaxID=1054297 RepID=A0ABS4K057_9CLOT|nr:hypothetical protein [Clostridium punense]MBP2021163.1 hypothetical protein [Clostridium punense]
MSSKKSLKISLVIISLVIVGLVGSTAYGSVDEYNSKKGKKREQLILENIEISKAMVKDTSVIEDKLTTYQGLNIMKNNIELKNLHINAYNTLVTARKTKTQSDINVARYTINSLPNSIDYIRNGLSAELDAVQNELMTNAYDASVLAQNTKNPEDYATAVSLYEELLTVEYNDGVLQWVREVLGSEINKASVK